MNEKLNEMKAWMDHWMEERKKTHMKEWMDDRMKSMHECMNE